MYTLQEERKAWTKVHIRICVAFALVEVAANAFGRDLSRQAEDVERKAWAHK